MALEEGRFFVGSMTDKRYEADGLAEYCRRFLSSGVWDAGTNLQVSAAGGLDVAVGYGAALVDGYPYRLLDNGTGLLTLTAEAGDALPRIDRIVVRKDAPTQRVYAYIKQGTPAASPAAPALERTDTVYEISLARITMAAGAGIISAGDITDERAMVTIHSALSAEIILAAHPVGSIYESTASTSPAVLFGGVWEAYGAGRVTVGYDAADSDFNAAGKTSGAKTTTLTQANLPSFVYIPYGTGTSGGSNVINNQVVHLGGTKTGDAAIRIDGGGASGVGHNNVQPSIVVYRWRRTA